jgi:autotransporter-associated beta strand protein
MSGSGTLELAGTNTYGGATTVASGTLRLAAPDALPSGTPLSLSAGASLKLNGYAATLGSLSGAGSIALGSATLAVAQAGNSTWSGVLSGTGGLAKSGAGTLTLSGTHSFTGATAINAGRLHLTGSATGSAFSVAAGAILSGTGSLGALTVAGTVSPGASPGTLSAGNTVFSPGGSLLWEINNATGVSGTNYDLLAISGTLDVAATSSNRFTVNLVSLLPDNSPGAVINFSPTQNYTYTFATTTAGILGFAPTDFTVNTASFTNALAGGTWSLAQAGNNLTLNFTAASAIPEPSTYAAIFGAAALALAAHRRRSQTASGQR